MTPTPISTIALWNTVDTLTQPTHTTITRDPIGDPAGDSDVDIAARLLHDLAHNPRRQACSILEYRQAIRITQAQTRRHGTIPSLWEQAETAVNGQGDSEQGSSIPARERSVADLTLMETLFTIREIVNEELRKRGVPKHARQQLSTVQKIRRLASLVAAQADHDAIMWWQQRLDQFVRIIATQINAVDNGPKPFRLRNTPCPQCGAKQIRVREDDEWRMVPPLRIHYRQGLVRAATCGACGKSWMRGNDLNLLADTIRPQIVADHATTA